MDGDVIFLFEVPGQMLGAIDGTVLSSGTTESDLQMAETPFDKPLHMLIDQAIYALQERQDLAVFLQEINHRLIQAGKGLVFLVFAGVVGTAAVEDITSTVTGLILRNSALE